MEAKKSIANIKSQRPSTVLPIKLMRQSQRVEKISGGSSVFCNEWLFMCASFYAFVETLVADCSAMAAPRLLGDIVTRIEVAASRLNCDLSAD